MTYRKVIRVALLCSVACAPISGAYAGIGGVGSPVTPSNLPGSDKPMRNVLPEDNEPAPTPAAAPAAAAPAPAERQALLVIRFNQRRVYYHRLLQQALSVSEKSHPDAAYDVVLLVPSASRKIDGDHQSAVADQNLQDVVHTMQDMGVSSSQIHTSTESSAAVGVQVVKIFVE